MNLINIAYKRLVSEIIRLAIKDLNNPSKATVKDAESFLNGNWCRELCEMTDLSYDNLQAYILKNKNL